MAFVAPVRQPPRSKLGRIVVATIVLLAVFAFVSAILQRLGIPAGWIVGAALVGTLLMYGAIGLGVATTRPSAFFVADRMLTASTVGLSSAAACLAVFGTAVAGWMFGLGIAGAVMVLGVCGGFVLSAVLFAPYLRRSGACSIPEFLAARFGRLTRILAVPAVFAVCFLLLVVQFQLAGRAAAAIGVPSVPAIWGMLALLLVCTVPGGTRAAAAMAVAQLLVVVVGLLGPLAAVYMTRFGTLSPAAVGEALASSAGALPAAPETGGAPGFSGLGFISVAMALALATASLPMIATPLLTARAAVAARRGSTIGLAAMLLVLVAAAGWAAVIKLTLLQWPAGTPIADVGTWGSATAGTGAILQAADLTFRPDGLLAAAPALLQLSATSTALLAAALLAALLSAAAACLVTASTVVSYDLLNRTLLPRATWSARLALGRISLVLTGLAAAYAAEDGRLEAVPLIAVALNLAAGVLFPVLAVGIWWNRAGWWGALTGMAAGLFVTVSFLALDFGGFATEGAFAAGAIVSPASQVIVWPGLLGSLSGLVGAVVNGLVIVIVSLSTRPPSADRQAFADALRRSQSHPLLHPDEARFGTHGVSGRASLGSG